MALRSHRRIITHTLCLCILLLPSIVFGQGTVAEQAAAKKFVPLVGIPYIEGNKVATFGDYVNALYIASISIAAFLAVVKIIFAGVKYMLSDIVTSKEDAKKEIRSALVGLLIVVGAVLILNTINPNLRQVNLFANAPIPGITTGVSKPAPKKPTLKSWERVKRCSDFPSKAACSSFCANEGGKIVSGGIINKGKTQHTTHNICVYTPKSPTSVPVAPGVTLDTSGTYTAAEISQFGIDLNKQGKLVAPVTSILHSEIDQEKKLCKSRGGAPYVLYQKSGNPGIAPKPFMFCIKK